jgi:hypothetical protein
MASQNPKLPVDLLAQIHSISVTKELGTIEEMKRDSPARRQLNRNLSDTIAMDMISPFMTTPMTQQQMFVMSQIMKYPGQTKEIIAAAMTAGVKAPTFNDL